LAKKQGSKKKIHIKIDTGMGRIGLLPNQAIGFIQDARHLSNVSKRVPRRYLK